MPADTVHNGNHRLGAFAILKKHERDIVVIDSNGLLEPDLYWPGGYGEIAGFKEIPWYLLYHPLMWQRAGRGCRWY